MTNIRCGSNAVSNQKRSRKTIKSIVLHKLRRELLKPFSCSTDREWVEWYSLETSWGLLGCNLVSTLAPLGDFLMITSGEYFWHMGAYGHFSLLLLIKWKPQYFIHHSIQPNWIWYCLSMNGFEKSFPFFWLLLTFKQLLSCAAAKVILNILWKNIIYP